MDVQIRMNAIMRWRKGKIFGMMRMNAGIIRNREAVAIVEPNIVSLTAWCPLPKSRSSWPGRVPSPVSSSGAPRKIAGMKSRNVWVIAIAVMKINKEVMGNVAIRGRIEIVMRLMWMPGVRPVRVPVRIPRRRGIRRLSI